MNTENILVRENDLELSQAVCATIEDPDVRSRAVANVLAVKIGSCYFDKETFQTDEETGLHNLCKALTDIDIADLYINNSYVDVRLYFSPDELGVPAVHFEHGIIPDVYMFIRVSQDLSEAEVTGFMKPVNIDTTGPKHGFYAVDEASLASFYDIETQLQVKLDTEIVSDEELYDYADNYTDSRFETIRKLVKSKSSRIKIAKILAAKEKFASLSVSVPPETEEANEEPAETSFEENEQQNVSEDIPAQNYDEMTEENDFDSLFEPEQNNNQPEQTDKNEEELIQALEFSTETTPNNEELLSQGEENGNSEQIDSLFNTEENTEEPVSSSAKKNSAAGCIIALLVIVLLLIAGVGGGIYYFSANISNKMGDVKNLPAFTSDVPAEDNTEQKTEDIPAEPEVSAEKEVAMPVETVETKPVPAKTEIGNSVAIPAIEHNLDASVLVSNLRVDWEVPAGYASNVAARRYLEKLGKVIQLNLKTELLLLNKPPLTNRITVELAFDNETGKYTVVGMPNPSGEESVDKIIKETVQKALSLSLSTKTETIGKLQGNPVLIIHL